MIGKKQKANKVAPIWEVHFVTSDGEQVVSWRADNRIKAVQGAKGWFRKAYPSTKIIKVARVVK